MPSRGVSASEGGASKRAVASRGAACSALGAAGKQVRLGHGVRPRSTDGRRGVWGEGREPTLKASASDSERASDPGHVAFVGDAPHGQISQPDEN